MYGVAKTAQDIDRVRSFLWLSLVCADEDGIKNGILSHVGRICPPSPFRHSTQNKTGCAHT